MEWRSRSYAAKLSDKVQDFHGLAFMEGAHLWVKDALAGQASSYNLASTGLGLRLNAWKNLNLALDLALPLRDGVYTERGDWRTEFLISYDFL